MIQINKMTDGLYQVTTPYLCAGFVIENGRVTQCAPILRKRIAYWMTIAKPVNQTGEQTNDNHDNGGIGPHGGIRLGDHNSKILQRMKGHT